MLVVAKGGRFMCVILCFKCVRWRGERKTGKERERETERQRDRETERQRKRERQRETERERGGRGDG